MPDQPLTPTLYTGGQLIHSTRTTKPLALCLRMWKGESIILASSTTHRFSDESASGRPGHYAQLTTRRSFSISCGARRK